jgi:hypothetical protein
VDRRDGLRVSQQHRGDVAGGGAAGAAAAFAAYALTFMRMPGADVWDGLIVSLLVVPTLVARPPLLRLECDLGLVGTTRPRTWCTPPSGCRWQC